MSATLSVVIPVYNESDWLSPTLDHLEEAINAGGWREAEIVVVDDGSEPPISGEVTKGRAVSIRLLRQRNQGRFAARLNGLEHATGEVALLIDSRVFIDRDSLAYVARERGIADGTSIWNGHVDVAVARNPYARFWNVLTDLAFREYFGNPRRTSFGLKEFDKFPKGTTCFLAPREMLLEACAAFESGFADLRDANDDTILIRWLAAREPINIAPSFRCLYHSRTSLVPFLRHAYHRGGVFVDGYGRPGTRFFPAIVAFYPSSLVALGALVVWPGPVGSVVLVGGLAIALIVSGTRRSLADGCVVAGIGIPFTVSYGMGIWRGLWLRLRGAVARGRQR